MDLKQLLMNLDKEDIKKMTRVEITALTYEMLDQLGSTDAELRDGLIYPIFVDIIESGQLGDGELNRIVEVCLDEKHLFYKLGEEGDSVFMRSFSSLIIAELLIADVKNNFLSTEAFSNLFDKAIWYIAGEKDTRGYVADKGWAHSIAHGADMLVCFAANPAFTADKIQATLDVVENCLFKGAVYVDDEDVRLVYVVKAMMKKGLSEEELTGWLESMTEKLELLYITEPHDHKTYRNLKSVRDFMESLYFNLKIEGGYMGMRVALFNGIRDLHKLQYGGAD